MTVEERMEEQELLRERYALMMERCGEIPAETSEYPDGTYAAVVREYFSRMAGFIMSVEAFLKEKDEILGEVVKEERAAYWNTRLYEDINGEAYETSMTNAAYLAERFGHEKDDLAGLLAGIACEIRGMIPYAYEGRLEEITILGELFVEVYSAFRMDMDLPGQLPTAESIRSILYWYAWDYLEFYLERRISEQLDPGLDFLTRIVEHSEQEDTTYLYRFGEYISANEIAMAKFIRSLSEEEIETMASAYTEAYRRGFEVQRKDLSKKKTVNIRFQAGFERVIARAIAQFRAMGLEPVIYRAPVSFVTGRAVKVGFSGASASRQYEYDHRLDDALVFNKKYSSRKLEVLRLVYEKKKELAAGHAGPAVVEFFGEKPFAPVSHKEAPSYKEAQQEQLLSFRSASSQIVQNYILPEERSFTIIAFPTPEIGENFPEIFREVVRINTLDNARHSAIQQAIVDALDTGVKVKILGENGNRTNLTVALWELQDPSKETIFENCVADQNVPAGEVFTSPKLEGTEGILHVSEVFLEELKYTDLELSFKDGMITSCRCRNFAEEEENQKFLKENLLHQHASLPMGEFAIGTNTYAYVMSRKYGIGETFPILIAEKTGPHFAVGDTCYSHEEEHAVYNPDGKEIVARENSCSVKRHEDPSQAYFQCHTDITIPYDELGSIDVIRADGSSVRILEHGRFVLPGTEELNRAFD